jgi:hypothetical protein
MLSDTGSEAAAGGTAALLLAGFDRPASAGRIGVPLACSRSPCALPARSGEVGAATEILLMKAEQVSDDRARAAGEGGLVRIARCRREA